MWDNYKRYNIHAIAMPEGEKRQNQEEMFEVITLKNFPKSVTDTKRQIQDSSILEGTK